MVQSHTVISLFADSRRTVVSNLRKYMHQVLVNHLGALSLPRKSVVRLTDCPHMTVAVYPERKTTTHHKNNLFINLLTLHGHACMKFYVVQAIVTSACKIGKHKVRRAMLSGDSSCLTYMYQGVANIAPKEHSDLGLHCLLKYFWNILIWVYIVC